MFFAFAVVYCASIALPGLLQALFGYDALALRAGDVPVGRLLDGRDGGRRRPAGPAGRRPLADRGRPDGHGRRQLLDGADEPPDQPGAGGLAADGADPGPGAAVRPDQRGRLQVHSRCICAGRRSDCSACSAPRGAASAPRWPRPSRSGASSSTCPAWARGWAR